MYSGLGLPSPRQNSWTESPSRTQPSVVEGLPTQKCTCSVGSKGKGKGETTGQGRLASRVKGRSGQGGKVRAGFRERSQAPSKGEGSGPSKGRGHICHSFGSHSF